MNQRRAALYLQIPAAYCRAFGGLRWAQYGEAVEFLDGPDAGRTFAFAPEIARFLEGLMTPGEPCMAFGCVLHLLFRIGLGERAHGQESSGRLRRLTEPFRLMGSPLRNAGALCAWLCREIPGVAEPPLVSDVLALLGGGSWIPQMVLSHPMLGAMDYAEQPGLEPTDFEARLEGELDALSDDEIRHWLKHGRGPVAPIAGSIGSVRAPRPGRIALRGRAASAARRHGPPDQAARRRVEPAPAAARPVRLADRRLLGPRDPGIARADPADPVRARARGIPPSVRGARAALFPPRDPATARGRGGRPAARSGGADLGRRSARPGRRRDGPGSAGRARRKSIKLATTGLEGEPVDPADLEPDVLAEILESSDFSPNPARLLDRLVPAPAGRARDVVLLTIRAA